MNKVEILGCPIFKSGIRIKKENRGKFTASAKAAGQSVQEHASSVLNDPNATPLQKKRANLARNAKKWKHQIGGVLKMYESFNGHFDSYAGNLKKKNFLNTRKEAKHGSLIG